jgi:hypothetical protein
VLGFREQQPGSGQWYESSQFAVTAKAHPRYNCWICEKHIYSVLLWSRGQAFMLNPILDESEANMIHVQIDAVD